MPVKTLVIIAGPTAIGKTTLSIELAGHFDSPIISADSRQFFREMNKGTAKPSDKNLQEATHYFINNKSIHEEYNAGIYEAECIALLEELFKKHAVIIAVGGSGLYINAICEGFDELPSSDPATRNYLKNIFKEKGISELQKLLKKYDPEYFLEVDINNPQRIMRAIEVSIAAGISYSSLRKNKTIKREFNILKIGLDTDREILYKRINSRTDEMIKSGLIEEARELYRYKELNPLQTVGYKELFEYFENKVSLEEAIEKIKQNTRNFAKRQLTWFRKDKSIKWFIPYQKDEMILFIKEKIQQD